MLDVVRTHARADVNTAEPAVDGEVLDTTAIADAASQLVMASARTGKRVVRAVVGDPGLDSCAAAEMLACARAGIPFEVVPGIASAVGVPAYAGVPLSGDVRFVDAATASDRCWSEVGASDATLVVSTTLQTVAATAAELIGSGRKPDTLLSVTVAGTTTRQRTWTATLATIAAELKATKALPTPEARSRP